MNKSKIDIYEIALENCDFGIFFRGCPRFLSDVRDHALMVGFYFNQPLLIFKNVVNIYFQRH